MRTLAPRDVGGALVTPARQRRRLRRRLLAADALIIAGSVLAAYLAREWLGGAGLAPFANEVPVAIAAIPLWLAVFFATGAYDAHHFARGGPGLRRFLAGATGGLVTLGFVSFVLNLQLSRVFVGLLFLLVATLGGAARLALRAVLRRTWRAGRRVQRALLVGADPEALAVAAALRRDPAAGYRLAGFLTDAHPVGHEILPGAPVVAGLDDDAARIARAHGAGLVVVSPTAVEPGTLRRLTLELEGSEIDLAIAPSLFEVVTRRVSVESIGNAPVLHVEQIRLEGLQAALKRTLDLAGAALLLLLAGPLMLAAALAVRLDSAGPVLFRQARVGRDGKPFTILKFRTMVADAEDRLDEVAGLNEAGHHFFKVRRDPRVTRVGRLLRKWSIDETPQLWNVLRGDMALVGPRPPLPREVARYEPWHMRRLRVRPGLTGLWQVSGRSDVDFDEAVRLDLFYIENWSVGLDLAILARTVRAVLGRDGAY